MKLELLNPTELMIYNEGVRDGLASVAPKKETEMSAERDKLIRDIEDAAYMRGWREASISPVKEFHEVFGHPVKTVPEVPDLEIRVLRVKLLLEEVLEFSRASGVHIYVSSGAVSISVSNQGVEFYFSEGPKPADIVEAADALADIRYVTDGANLCWGLDGPKLLAEVHRSNMSKLGEDGKPIRREDGKIVKGPNYENPDIKKVLIEAGWKREAK